MKDSFHFVIFVQGTTASGKSRWALDMAQKWGGVIVNCDSVQCYQGLEIGSALPTPQDQALVTHYLYSYLPKGETQTAGRYHRDFYNLLSEFEEPQIFWVVGGTGFYFQAIEKGMYPVNPIPEEIRADIAEQIKTLEGAAFLYDELQSKDPVAAQRISRNDFYRIGRALELIRSEGMTLGEIQKKFESLRTPFPYPLLKIGICQGREKLGQTIVERTRSMLARGLVAEVEGLLKEGFRDWAPLSSVGYRETLEYLDQGHSLEWLETMINQSTLQLAKKQRTWFQRDKQILWKDSSGTSSVDIEIGTFLKEYGTN